MRGLGWRRVSGVSLEGVTTDSCGSGCHSASPSNTRILITEGKNK